MLITHPPRKTRHKRLVSAGTATPTQNAPRATDAPRLGFAATRVILAAPTGVGGRYSGGAVALPYAIAKGRDSLSRGIFL